MGLTPSRLSGVVIIAFLSGINLLGVKAGSRIQNILTVIKIASLAVLIFWGLYSQPQVPPDSKPTSVHPRLDLSRLFDQLAYYANRQSFLALQLGNQSRLSLLKLKTRNA